MTSATVSVPSVSTSAERSPLEIQGEAIPAVGFGQLTVMATVLGIGIAALARRLSA